MALAVTAGELTTSIERMIRHAAERDVKLDRIEMTRRYADVIAKEYTNQRLPESVDHFNYYGLEIAVVD